MTPQLIVIKTRLRLNKLHSQDYDNIEDWKIMEAVNKAQLSWFRRQVHGSNRMQEGDEQTRVRVDDIQKFLIEIDLVGKSKSLLFESDPLPDNYLWFKEIIPIVSKGNCQQVLMDSTFIEEANVPTYLFDWSSSPSFEWRQTFHTLINSRLRVYTNDDFEVNSVKFTYYRAPNKVDINGYTHEDGTPSGDSDLEFKDDVAELILDEAASILAADVEYAMAAQVTAQRSDANN